MFAIDHAATALLVQRKNPSAALHAEPAGRQRSRGANSKSEKPHVQNRHVSTKDPVH